MTLPDTGRAARWTLIGLVAAVGAGLGIAGWFIARRRHPANAQAAAELAAAAAALDGRYRDREADTPAAEWQAYQDERARLKRAIAAALAARNRGT